VFVILGALEDKNCCIEIPEKLFCVDAFVSVFIAWCFWRVLVMDVSLKNTIITNLTEQVCPYIYTIEILPVYTTLSICKVSSESK
jgi:hypothetical protein